MKYTAPVYYKNNILEEYVPKDAVTEEDVKKHIEELIPFLEEDAIDLDGFHLTPVRENRKIKKETKKFSSSISDKNFEAILPKD